ncbi:Vesicle membrane receptor protein (v-SNARE) [Blastocladiella emersonii ATCC 22665]|nr:Vesicle membrane receptor protein (v-SNARE) [Blastocladiella emersonii ATCC 22665]
MSSVPFAGNTSPAGGQQQGGAAGNGKTSAIQNQVNEVVGIMQQNIEKVMERGERLDTLQNKTEDLNHSAGQFRRGATKVRKQMWWKNMKLKIIIALVVIAVLLAIILPLVTGGSSSEQAKP